MTTTSGEELIVLTRREYDVLLAQLGDEDAEDRMTIRLVDEARAALDAGTEFLLPVWFSDGLMANRNPIRTVREHCSRTPAQMAQAAGITEEQLARFESGKALPPAAILDAISADAGIDPRILRRMYEETDA
ncbi:helix-turn-helix transcriptional regulator [Methylobacterium sp. WL9]|uniref:helix-turn-helix domain-containing protein n=1 Tax=Methylobacterium sp. WL9 TaxID=2603898 RepID=UPI0011CAF9DE|nr:helix-turn-helix transcriptional regulator [Methylobacterium sp. WL9]TXN21688.1 helix-turn-helix transcriptional regulator [Methylobacterium sp. WL9]